MVPKREQIVEWMKGLDGEAFLRFSLPATFGGGVAIIRLNPAGGKKYLLQVGRDEKSAQDSPPYWSHDKCKPIAKWVNDRLGARL